MNITVIVSEFILQCAINSEQRSQTISALIIVYLVTLFGNLFVIVVIKSNHHLQTPMYWYIAILAFIDLLNSTNLIPKMVAVILDSSVILYGLCAFQMIFLFHLEVVEVFLFALMACDRFIAVVHPLRYHVLITKNFVFIGVLIANFASILILFPFMIYISEFSFCHTNVLPYCFCDYITMVQISCNDNPKYLITSSTATFISVVPLAVILFSYYRIVWAALKISSVDGKRKVLSTCMTHLIVMGLFYFPLMISFVLPGMGVQLSAESHNIMVIVASIVPPMMNPIIYSFRNHEIKISIYKMFAYKKSCSKMNGY